MSCHARLEFVKKVYSCLPLPEHSLEVFPRLREQGPPSQLRVAKVKETTYEVLHEDKRLSNVPYRSSN